MTKQIKNTLKILILALALSFGLSYAYAWTAPTATPPNGNVSAPLNTSATAQTKAGNYDISAGSAYNYNGVKMAIASTTLSNYFFGRAGSLSMRGSRNTAIGEFALITNNFGFQNTASGASALTNNYTGIANTATGVDALYNNDSGSSNTASGRMTLYSNITGGANTALGDRAGYGDSTPNMQSSIDSGATFLGYQASRDASVSSTTALTNITAIGMNARVGASNTLVLGGTGANAVNVGIGKVAPIAMLDVAGDILVNGVTIGKGASGVWSNTALGVNALASSTLAGNGNTAVGYDSLANTGGSATENTAIGHGVLSGSNTGAYNVAVGSNLLNRNTTGAFNLAIGAGALGNNLDGSFNKAIGTFALLENIHGRNNIAIGENSLQSTNATGTPTSGSGNLGVGDNTLRLNTTGYNNTAYGTSALFNNTTGFNNTAVGYGANVSTSTLSNATAIGNGAIVNVSNKIVLGNASATTVGGYGVWTNYSDRRLKENIYYKNDLGLDFITALKTASFNYKNDTNKVRRDGLIAQDVQAVLENLGVRWSGLVVDNDEQKTLNISYDSLTIPLINAVKELKAENDKLKADNDDLRLRIEKIEARLK